MPWHVDRTSESFAIIETPHGPERIEIEHGPIYLSLHSQDPSVDPDEVAPLDGSGVRPEVGSYTRASVTWAHDPEATLGGFTAVMTDIGIAVTSLQEALMRFVITGQVLVERAAFDPSEYVWHPDGDWMPDAGPGMLIEELLDQSTLDWLEKQKKKES